MSVVRVRIQKDFTVLSNKVLEDPNLSFKAKGLWAYCMSRPDNWEFHISHLATVSKEGREAIYSAMDELIEAKLVYRHQEKKGRGEGQGRGTAGKVEYYIYPYPQDFSNNFSETGFTEPKDTDPKNPPLTSTDLHQELKEKIVCPPEPVAPLALKIRKTTSDEKEIVISQDDVVRHAIGSRKDWSTLEILEAWEILVNYPGVINDALAFIGGTIKKMRIKNKFEKMEKTNNATNKKEKDKWSGIMKEDPTKPIPAAIDMTKLLYPE